MISSPCTDATEPIGYIARLAGTRRPEVLHRDWFTSALTQADFDGWARGLRWIARRRGEREQIRPTIESARMRLCDGDTPNAVDLGLLAALSELTSRHAEAVFCTISKIDPSPRSPDD